MQTQFKEVEVLVEKTGRSMSKAVCTLTGKEVYLETINRQWLGQNQHYSATKGRAVMAARAINHRGFLKVLASIHDQDCVYIATEWAEGGNLRALMQKKVCLSEPLVLSFLVQLASSLGAASETGVVLGDLNSRDVYIKDSELKISMPLGCCFTSGRQNLPQHCNGRPLYIAPEVLNREDYQPKADIWSLGVLIFEMMFGTLPLIQTTLAKITDQLKTFRLSLDESSGSPSQRFLQRLLNQMLVVDPAARISISDLTARMGEMHALLSSHAILGLKVELEAIEYHCDPTITRVETAKARQKLQRLQSLVDQAHQVNRCFGSDPNQALKWLRFEFKWFLHLLHFTASGFITYTRPLPMPILAGLADRALDQLLEYERKLPSLSCSADVFQLLQRQVAVEKSSLLELCADYRTYEDQIASEDVLQR